MKFTKRKIQRIVVGSLGLACGIGLHAGSAMAASSSLYIQDGENSALNWNLDFSNQSFWSTAPTGVASLNLQAVANYDLNDAYTYDVTNSALKWHTMETQDGGYNNFSSTNVWRTIVTINDIHGNADPFMTYAFSVKNNTAATQNYSFTYGEAIDPVINGAYSIYADLGASITNGTGSNVTVTPTSGSLQSVQLSSDGGATFVNGGVDVGGTLTYAGTGTNTSGPFTATNAGSGSFDYWQFVTNFSLTAKKDTAAFTGYTEITPIPLPAGFWLLGTALVSLFGTARRRQA